MKKLMLIACVAFVIVACSHEKKQLQEGEIAQKTSLTSNVYGLDSLLVVADKLVDKDVTVRGFVTHTCKHSGKRCFIVGESQKASLRVEAKGDIGGFNRELIGSELAISGVLKERKLSREYIDQYEKDVNEKKLKEDGSAETCQAELNNIQEMRDWMKSNNKDYYSIYYMDGQNYEVVEK